MARTVVTGSNGLLGSALRRLNLPDTVFLTREEVDLTDFSAVDRLKTCRSK
jgi:dTDP-4-dehydrorhamnose reductase